MSWQTRVEAVMEAGIDHVRPLTGGMIAEVYAADLTDGRRIVVKVGNSAESDLDIEGYMLDYLGQHSRLPVPQVLHCEDTLLVMTFVDGQSHLGAAEQQHAAELLTDLHSVTQPQFGLERDTLIGPLHQPNPLSDSWIDFFRDHRLLYMARVAHVNGALPATLMTRIEKLSARLPDWLLEPERPSLIHGDIWATNILTHNGRIAAFVDPAIYYAHAEIELAYMALFGTFGYSNSSQSPFFRHYHELQPIAAGFFEERRDIYNLYPLLVHVRLFGGSYVNSVEATLGRFGC